jgi:hypothetical protein
MKTPREVLFEKLQGVESKLDKVRAEVLAASFDGKAKTNSSLTELAQSQATSSWFVELLQSLRPHFVGLAGVWLIILGINFATGETPSPMLAETAAPSPEVIATLKEQKQLYSQLIGTGETGKPSEPAVFERRPRSEARQHIRIV